MAYRYSLRDENDPLLSLLDQGGSDNAPSLSEPYQQPPAADPGQQDDVLTSMLLDQGRPRGDAYQPSPAAASQNADRASLDAAWTQREREALDASKPQKYGVWEGLRDNAAPVLAGALDSIFNKGRGLGNIVQGAAGEVGAQQARRDAQRKQEGDLALKIRGKQGDDLAAQRLDYLNRSLLNRDTSTTNVQKRHDEDVARKDDPSSQHNATAEEMAFLRAQAAKQGGAEGAHQYAQTGAEDAALKTGANTNASTDALAANPRALTEEQRIQNQLAREQLDTSQGIRQQGVDQKNRDTFNAQNKDVLDVVENAQKLRDIFSRSKGGDLPGLGPIDSNTPSWLPEGLGGPSQTDLDVRNLVAQFKNPGVHARSGAAVNPSERPALEAEFGKIGDEKSTQTAIDNIYNTMVSKLRGAAVGKEDLVREILAARGLHDVLPPAAAQAAQPMQPGGGGAGFDPNQPNPDNLGVTGGYTRRDVPAGQQQPAPQGATGMVTIRLGNETKLVPFDQAQRLKQRTPELEILQ